MIARLTIYQRIVALTAAAILLSLGAMMIVTFRGPPPVSRPLGLDEVRDLVAGRPPPDWHVERGAAALPTPGLEERPVLADEIARRAGRPAGTVRLFAMPGPPPGGRHGLLGPFTLAVREGAGWQIFHAEPRPAILRWYLVTMGLMAGVFLLLMLPVRRIARTIGDPIARLAAAADGQGADASLGLGADGRDAPPEIRALVFAMEGMQRRIREQDRDRSALLRAIAHDLRTPMTRLSFRVDRLPDDQRARAQADIAEMRTMIAAILDFMDGRVEVRPARLDLVSLIEAMVDGYREQGADITVQTEERLVVEADAALLRRAVQNVIDNALRYAGAARITLSSSGNAALLVVEDDGPGIPAAVIGRATEPFWRGEASRARSTGGVGLGLAIVQEAMVAMHGSVLIANRADESGLRVALSLPLALA